MPEQEEQPRNQESVESRNEPVLTESFMRHRLDPDETLRRIKKFLTGKELRLVKDENGNYVETFVKVNPSKANDEGVDSIMWYLNSYINKDTVQAHFKRDTDFLDMVGKARSDLLDAICQNMERWEIDDNDLRMIMSTCMGYLKAFLTRGINNKERDSYTQAVKETHTFDDNKKNKRFGFV